MRFRTFEWPQAPYSLEITHRRQVRETTLPGSRSYAEDAGAMQRSHKRIAGTFPVSRVYQAHIPTYAAGYWLFGFASKKYHPIDDLDAAAWNALNMRTRYYTTRLHVGAFYLPAFLEEMLREVEDR